MTAWQVYASENDSKGPGPNTYLYDPANMKYDWVEGATDTTVEQEIEGTGGDNQGIKGGALYPYYEEAKLVHCPSDNRFRNKPTHPSGSGDGAYRTYSFAKGIPETTDIKNPSSKFILVEENDNRGINMNSWVMKRSPPNSIPGLVDPFAVFHNMRSTLGFADGHAKKIVWKDNRTEEFSDRINNGGTTFSTTFAEEVDNKDFEWLNRHYPGN